MENEKKILQGASYDFEIDASNLGAFDSIGCDIYIGNMVAVRFEWPDTEGFEKLTQSSDTYLGTISSDITDAMLGMYGIIPYVIVDGNKVKKGFNSEFVEVIQKPV